MKQTSSKQPKKIKSRSLIVEISCRRNYFKKSLLRSKYLIQNFSSIKFEGVPILTENEIESLKSIEDYLEKFYKEMYNHRLEAYKKSSEHYQKIHAKPYTPKQSISFNTVVNPLLDDEPF